jgi:flagellar biosynthesis/type III secretory pathway M-ring protein FliF/YscJ
VQAVDGAGVKSDWTNGQLFRIAGMNLMTIVLVAVAIIILFLIIRRVRAMRHHGSWK